MPEINDTQFKFFVSKVNEAVRNDEQMRRLADYELHPFLGVPFTFDADSVERAQKWIITAAHPDHPNMAFALNLVANLEYGLSNALVTPFLCSLTHHAFQDVLSIYRMHYPQQYNQVLDIYYGDMYRYTAAPEMSDEHLLNESNHGLLKALRLADRMPRK